jgi:hypothetical protein
MRSCEEYQSWLIDSLADADIPHTNEAAAHVERCETCATTTRELRASWASFGQLPPLEPPAAVRDRARGAVLELLAAERREQSRRRVLEASHVPLAVVSGVLVAGATLALLGGLIWGSTLPRGHLFFCAALFTGLLVGVFSWIYGATTVQGVHLDAAGRVGILALAISVAATTACPELHVLAWWDRSAPGLYLTRVLGAGGSSLVFGYVYGLLPGFLAALFGGRLLAERPVANGLVTVGVVVLLAAPVIYLQSAPFTAGVLASWLAGTAIGTLCGVFGALRVRRRVALTPAIG